ncbi:MAG: GAF domain-containing protein [Leptospiraceae bacterium]|nr:GAF domain-containing protein [Leptospiraceae bacterium]
MKKIKYLLFLFFLFFECTGKSMPLPPKAEKGTLDLKTWNFSTNAPVQLSGEWIFQRKKFLNPSLSTEAKEVNSYLNVPGAWISDLSDPNDSDRLGYGTYFLRIKLPEFCKNPSDCLENKPPDLMLSLPSIYTSYRLYLNGRYRGGEGMVARDESAIPSFKLKQILIHSEEIQPSPDGERILDLMIHISNYHHRSGGIFSPILLGSYESISELKTKKMAMDFFLVGSLLMMSFYHLGIYFGRKKELSALWFAIYCLLIVLRVLVTGERYLHNIFPLESQILFQLEYIDILLIIIAFTNFIYYLFRQEFSHSMKIGIQVISVFMILPVWMRDSFGISKFLIYIQISLILSGLYFLIVISKAIRNKKKEAKVFMGGILFLFGFVIHDILSTRLVVPTPHLLQIGVLGFTIVQALVLSMQFTKALSNSEKFSHDLILAQSELEVTNKFISLINSHSDLNYIFIEISKYIYERFGILGTWLFLPDRRRKYLFTFKAYSYQRLPENQYQFLMNMTLPLDENGGVIAKVFQRKRPLYLPVLIRSNNEIDNRITETLELKSLLHVPLISKGECVGVICLSNMDRKMKLNKKEILRISDLCNQISGVIETAHLLDLVKREKENTELARLQIEKQKQETEDLNHLIKSLNQEFDIITILKKIGSYISLHYDIHHYALHIVQPEKKIMKPVYLSEPENIPKEVIQKIYSFDVPITSIAGGHGMAYKAKRPVYFPRIKKIGLTEEELYTIENFRLESFLIVPLILNNEPIGFLDLYNIGKIFISKEQLSQISILGEQLSGIVRGANLLKQVQYEKMQSEIAKSKLEFINEFSRVINSSRHLEEIINHAIIELSDRINADIFLLQLIDSRKHELFTRYFSGNLGKEKANELFNLRIDLRKENGSISRILQKKKTLYFPDVRRIPPEFISDLDRNWLVDLQTNSTLQVPLVVHEKVIGIFQINCYGGLKKLLKGEIEFTEVLCEQLAIAINNSYLYELTEEERLKSEKLLLNILPKDVAEELKEKGTSEPVLFEKVSVMFTDFKGFTQIAETLTPEELIKDLDACFVQFDKISERFNLEKLKTIGDSYMCAGGIPKKNHTHAIDCVLASLEIQDFMNLMKRLKEEKGFPYWELRLGIHTGPLIAGVIGEKKFAYDVWGDTVNTASRMESSGTPGKINISETTYNEVKEFFDCEFRGEVQAKNKGMVKMYYVNGLKKEFSKDGDTRTPNEEFWSEYGESGKSIGVD